MCMEYKHTFVVCAYKESEYLGECIESLIAQTVKSRMFISTSTPNEYIYSIAKKYSLEVFVNTGESGITQDWNFGISNVTTEYYTVAHQDDIYEPQYTESVLAAAEKNRDTIIVFTKYYEIRNGKKVYSNKLLRVKNLMNFPLLFFKNSRFVRNSILSFGISMSCPSIMYCMDKCRNYHFDNDFCTCCDWDYVGRVSNQKGSFIYINKALVGHRIHPESFTTETIENGVRAKEELIMFRRYWSDGTAKRLASVYKSAMKSNKIN